MPGLHREDALLPYKVGGLLYAPATKKGVAENLIDGKFPGLTSIAFCLEDSVMDSAVPEAERQLVATLSQIEQADSKLPLLFVRVRTPQHLFHVHEVLGSLEDLLTGYVLPKFDTYNADEFLDVLSGVNAGRRSRIYAMPILESASISRIETRQESLSRLASAMGFYKDLVLNVRVGGNDLCSQFGIRRDVDQDIYGVGVVRDALVDIANVFCRDYVVSGPVWEYYGQPGGAWEDGLRKEMRLDALNGFIGKTAIHPSQLPVIRDCLKVSKADYADARGISDWSDDTEAVSGGSGRMNELKCHRKWADKILCLAEVYGVKDD